MTLKRGFLTLVSLMLAGFGIAYLVQPATMSALVGIQLTSTAASSDVRAVYGGLELGLAAILVYCLVNPNRTQLGLWLTAVLFGALAISRGIGMLLDRPVESLTWKVFVVEVGTAAIASLLALKVPASRS